MGLVGRCLLLWPFVDFPRRAVVMTGVLKHWNLAEGIVPIRHWYSVLLFPTYVEELVG